jgi:hypothetical protein
MPYTTMVTHLSRSWCRYPIMEPTMVEVCMSLPSLDKRNFWRSKKGMPSYTHRFWRMACKFTIYKIVPPRRNVGLGFCGIGTATLVRIIPVRDIIRHPVVFISLYRSNNVSTFSMPQTSGSPRVRLRTIILFASTCIRPKSGIFQELPKNKPSSR